MTSLIDEAIIDPFSALQKGVILMMEQIQDFFISAAYAADSAGPTQPSGMPFMLMIVIFILFFYLMIWRPQNKRAREQQVMLSALAKGDEVITAGGLLGRISKVTDQYITVAISDNTEVVMQKTSVANVLPKGTLKAIE